MNPKDLELKTLAELRTIAKVAGIQKIAEFKKGELVAELLKNAPVNESKVTVVKAVEPKVEVAAKVIENVPVEVTRAVAPVDSQVSTINSVENNAAAVESATASYNYVSNQNSENRGNSAPVTRVQVRYVSGNGASSSSNGNSNNRMQSNGGYENKRFERRDSRDGRDNRRNSGGNNRDNGMREMMNNNNNDYKEYENVATEDLGENFQLVKGVLEVQKDRTHGIIRTEGVLPGDNDAYISGSQIKKFNLRTGDLVTGPARLPKDKEKYMSLLRVDTVFDKPASAMINRKNFAKLTPIYPNKQMKLETVSEVISTRLIDLLSPIGYGQRAMIVAPPKAGKTTLLKEIAHGVTANDPNAKVMVVLVGERPEEVTDMQRSVKGEVYASNFDELPEHNCKVAEIALERAKRLVELGDNVVILMDSITRLARAYNITLPTSGKTLSGGFDPVALYPPKRFFGAARNFEEGGSLTIIATALVETGSRMDDLVYEEFKGTGNMELHLDRKLQQMRIFPAIDVNKSGTRNEELLLDKEVLNQSWRIRKMLEMIEGNEQPTEVLIHQLRKSKTNKDFLATLHEAVQ